MRDKLNCPNCGAPLESNRCKYCGTTFYDFASLESGTPCYMRVRLNNALITMKAIPQVEAITTTHKTVTAYGGKERVALAQFNTGTNLDMNVSFKAIADSDDKQMMKIYFSDQSAVL